MAEKDPVETQRDVVPKVTAELTAAGFEEAHEIGRGGFGVVYRCVQAALDRSVAVKVLTADLDKENLERFFREQRAMGRLTGHPNIVNVLQVGATDSGRPFIVMQYHPQASLDVRIRREGPLRVEEVLRLGVKMAGALETAHRLEILHRDVKPANILFTGYGEPALTDFGIAHISGGFETATGAITGSPAFTAPEVLRGQPPSPASDIYGLGATLFCAVTGHAAFERRSGEQLVAQFLRMTTQPVPDLRGRGIPEDVCAVVERAMSANPEDRPPAAEVLGDELRQIQSRHAFAVGEMALYPEPGTGLRQRDSRISASLSVESASSGPLLPAAHAVRGPKGNLPLELTSFIGRRRDLSEVKKVLSNSRLVTLTGIGGVGKTRLALRVANEVRRGFVDGVWLVELGDLRDESLVADMVAAALGLRDQSARPVQDVLVEFLSSRRVLLVLDNCERVVGAVADLAETLLRTCADLRILATSREPLAIGGEGVFRVPPLPVSDPDRPLSLGGLPQYDALTLFVERASEAVPTFVLTEENRDTVARICHRLDGLPLSIELAAARLRAMSADQILDRLTDRYKLLTLGNRGAPSRQQTLRLCIDWSHELSTPEEQKLWGQLSIFAGSFELDAAEDICADDLTPDRLLDVVASLVDKSILIREEADSCVRFRLLETLRDYGREKIMQTDEYPRLRRRHRDWYQKLTQEAEAEWIGPRQRQWVARLARELPNLREAMEFCLDADDTDTGLRIAGALYPFWLAKGLLGEGRRWFGRLFAIPSDQASTERVKALFSACVLSELQGDRQAGAALVEEGQVLADQISDPMANALIASAVGFRAIMSEDFSRACSVLEDALEVFGAHGALLLRVWVLDALGLAYDMRGDTKRAIAYYEEVLAITDSRGESMQKSYTLWSMGVAVWRQGDLGRAVRLLKQGLRLSQIVDDALNATVCLEVLAWIAYRENDARRAAVLMGAAEALAHAVGSSAFVYPSLVVYHEECERMTCRVLGERMFERTRREGKALGFEKAVAYALGEQVRPASQPPATATHLTKRERQVADLVAKGLTNKAIANNLMISQRTAQGHVEHILTKLGFTSRAQIAAWVAEEDRQSSADPT
ncbi:MAG: tetratricopeptide repeat protein [Hyphomicrobiales bacterium]|nr:MAG: tetratricopeptide repeat protein [Hyphomicrobiales bacterium]